MDFNQFNLVVEKGLALESVKLEDAQELYELIHENQDFLSYYMLWVEKTTCSHYTHSFLERALKQAKTGELLPLKILKKKELAGFIGVEFDIWHRKVELGYWLGQAYTRQGVMIKCVQSLVNHLFENRLVHRAQIFCAESNEHSIKIPQKLGFQQEGRLKEGALTKEGYEDILIFGLVNSFEQK